MTRAHVFPFLPWLVIAFLVTLFAREACAAADSLPLSELAKPGRILMLRHAYAPGTGDPPNFRLDDCAAQRNLDASGRAQAVALGQRLRQAGIAQARIFSSQWCRCLETARLLDIGTVSPLPALNSFYERAQERKTKVAALRGFLAELPPDGAPVVLVTHQFTINVFTDAGTPSGGGSLFQLNGSGAPRLLGTIEAN
ncbi:MAG: histidine phosphatase family protein [Burkholderiales bacterium]|nr:histidine phosphatase family protein [Burkholderiales bacterium]